MRGIFIKKKKEIITGGACLLVALVIAVGSKVKANPTPISSSSEKSNTNEISRKLNDSRADASKNSDLSESNNGSNNGGSEGNTASKEQSKNSSSSNQNGDDSSSGSKFKDGTFSGSAQGFKGDVKVNVVVSGGKITTIDVVENPDDEEYFSKAKTLIDEIINTQSTDVNVVSGATYSSNGIINAVANALK
ncbi:FMN-binding protein [Peptostreptococcus sp. D1]|uniref:FMN-binding protein n=1 Tax=Peptostreptococcus sp. D1 TaxID=72304 RepID=UPI0008F4323F|nr:FMN-binding protein [Peptostreptococcus sp. D1]SFE80501.1 FMN-binding domain-containing protein [Peptostreptococcus sp. D1]